MKKITLKTSNQKLDFSIGRVKWIWTNETSKRYEILDTLDFALNKNDISEFAADNEVSRKVWIDHVEVDIRKTEYFSLHANQDFASELKLGSKAILSRYIEANLDTIEIDEITQTIKTLLDDFATSIEDIINKEDSSVQYAVSFSEFCFKNYSKLMEVQFIKEDSIANRFDYTFDELIISQMKQIEEIAKRNRQKQFFISIDLIDYSKELTKHLKDLKQENVFVIVLSNTLPKTDDIAEVVSMFNKNIDWSNEVDLYNELVLEYPKSIDIDQTKDLLNALLTDATDKQNNIKAYL